MDRIGIFGAGSLAQEVFLCIDSIYKSRQESYNFIGFFDDNVGAGTGCKYGKVVGGMEELNSMQEVINIAIGIGNPAAMQSVSARCVNSNIIFPNFIHPSVLMFDELSIKLGVGNIISPLCLISYDVSLGNFNFFNTRCSLGHHVKIGDFNTFNPNIQISGNVKIGNQNIFGLNSTVIQGKSIGDKNTLGAGSILLRNIKDGDVYIGNPALKFKF